MQGFTIGLALLDYVPVLAFGGAMVLVGTRFPQGLFLLGACLSFLAGAMKATWKLILGAKKKDIPWLNKPFLPLQSCGWILMILAVMLSIKKISWTAVIQSMLSFPQAIFYLLWVLFLFGMVIYKKRYFKKEDAKRNWIAEIINSIAQCSLLLAVVLS